MFLNFNQEVSTLDRSIIRRKNIDSFLPEIASMQFREFLRNTWRSMIVIRWLNCRYVVLRKLRGASGVSSSDYE